MNQIEQFKQELNKRAQERDPNAYVTIHQTAQGMLNGELLAVFHLTGSSKEYYSFNPSSGDWVVVYNL